MWTVIIILIVMYVAYVVFTKKYGYAMHTASYYAIVKQSLQAGQTSEEAMQIGLKTLQRQRFFDQLTDVEIEYLVKAFSSLDSARFDSARYLGVFASGSIKDADIRPMKDRKYIDGLIERIKQE